MFALPNSVSQTLDTRNTVDNVETGINDESPTNRISSETKSSRCQPPVVRLSEDNSNPTLSSVPTFNSDQSQTYRILPIISGVLIPLLIPLSMPSLKGHWYTWINGDVAEVAHSHSLFLAIGMGLSVICGVLANVCLVLRFTERQIREMTLLCIILLSIHELINIFAATIFTATNRFTYPQSFWMSLCATMISIATNITLIIDYTQTKDFAKCGSGLTHKQRSLVIMIVVLICYITFGSFVQTYMLNISYIDALYFTIVSIEAIGFGDIHATNNGTRIFICIYATGGILNLALAFGLSQEALLEAAAVRFRERVKKVRAGQRKRHIKARWRAAVKWRLQANNLPLWIPDGRVAELGHDSRCYWWASAKQTCSLWWKKLSHLSPCYHSPSHKRLNLNALTEAQLEAAALEAGAPLADLLPSRFETLANDVENMPDSDIQHQPPLTHMRIGGMVSRLGQFAVAFTHNYAANTPTNEDDTEDSLHNEKGIRGRHAVPFTRTLSTMQDDSEESFLKALEAEEKIAFTARLLSALFLFVVFWMAGSATFMTTEGWEFGEAAYFCFIAFSTVGYGDFAPKSQTGRSLFVVWALFGVGTMTILISTLTEAYSRSYKSAIRTEIINASSSNENANALIGTRQGGFDSRTNTLSTGTGQEFPPYLHSVPSPFRKVRIKGSPSFEDASPVFTGQRFFGPRSKREDPALSQVGNATFPSSWNDRACKILPSVPLVQNATQKQTSKSLTALSLEILCHAEKLQSLINSVGSNQLEAYIGQVEKTIQDIVATANIIQTVT